MEHAQTFRPIAGHLNGKGPKILAGLSLGALILFGATHPATPDMLSTLSEPEALAELITRIGPVAVVVLLALAVVISPIPSGPIAMAAGAPQMRIAM